MNLYQEKIGVDQLKRFFRSEEEFERLMDIFIEQTEMNLASLKRNGMTLMNIKGWFLFVIYKLEFKISLSKIKKYHYRICIRVQVRDT
jgi:hypothetical protein